MSFQSNDSQKMLTSDIAFFRVREFFFPVNCRFHRTGRNDSFTNWTDGSLTHSSMEKTIISHLQHFFFFFYFSVLYTCNWMGGEGKNTNIFFKIFLIMFDRSKCIWNMVMVSNGRILIFSLNYVLLQFLGNWSIFFFFLFFVFFFSGIWHLVGINFGPCRESNRSKVFL